MIHAEEIAEEMFTQNTPMIDDRSLITDIAVSKQHSDRMASAYRAASNMASDRKVPT